MSDQSGTNQLIHETSPYLLQHAHNPVAWYPWTEQALLHARDRNQPILLSVGYSACHWCHVMAHESFEDADTAALMNRLYVNIKVDREERPDLDRVYQLAHQMLSERAGGWPLTVFLTPADLTPFFAGTYFPKLPRYGMPTFTEVLTQVAEFYRNQKEALHTQNRALRDAFTRMHGVRVAAADELDSAPREAAYRDMSANFDPRFGGFGSAPKFPHPYDLEFLLSWTGMLPDTESSAREGRGMLETTLTRMAEGGLYDQLGGGFCRYAVDEEWMIPHFEKMLYDNGALLAVYAQAAKLTGDGLYGRVARETGRWVMNGMQASEGGYFASLDADSEGIEGNYYAWDKTEIQRHLTAREYSSFALRFGLDRPANFGTRWHLRVTHQIGEIADSLASTQAEVQSLLHSARLRLLNVREKRVRPGLDDKVLTAWNGLMIRGMTMAGRLLDEPDLVESAERALDFIQRHLWHEGRLGVSFCKGRATQSAYLDDYAFLLDGILEHLQTRWDGERLAFACVLADALLMHFEDRHHGGFWFTAEDADTPLHRPKTFADDSLPAGNAIAARALRRLGHLCAEPRYLEAAERTVKAAWPGLVRHPQAHAAMQRALQDEIDPPTFIVMRGEAPHLSEWRHRLEEQFDPRRLVLSIPSDARHLTGLLGQCAARGDICAYICRGTHCSSPVTDIDGLGKP